MRSLTISDALASSSAMVPSTSNPPLDSNDDNDDQKSKPDTRAPRISTLQRKLEVIEQENAKLRGENRNLLRHAERCVEAAAGHEADRIDAGLKNERREAGLKHEKLALEFINSGQQLELLRQSNLIAAARQDEAAAQQEAAAARQEAADARQEAADARQEAERLRAQLEDVDSKRRLEEISADMFKAFSESLEKDVAMLRRENVELSKQIETLGTVFPSTKRPMDSPNESPRPHKLSRMSTTTTNPFPQPPPISTFQQPADIPPPPIGLAVSARQPEQRAVACKSCFSHWWESSCSGDPCSNCHLEKRECQRTRCYNFDEPEKCPKGESCRYAHITDGFIKTSEHTKRLARGPNKKDARPAPVVQETSRSPPIPIEEVWAAQQQR